MGHGHGQSAARAGRGRLLAVFLISLAVLVVEVVGGLVTGSLALLADAGHMLTDVAGIGLALLAIWFAGRPATPERTFGHYRFEILAAVVNAVLLFGVAVVLLVVAWRRMADPPEIASGWMLEVAVVGLATGLPVLTAHVVVDDSCFQDGHAPQMLDQLQACVAEHFPVSIEHSTFQLEPAGHRTHEHGAHA